MKILVTGATGLIGSHLVNYLTEEKNIKFVRAVGRKKNSILNFNNIEYIEADLTDITQCYKVTSDIDTIYHLAAEVGGIKYLLNNQAQILTRNTLINFNMLEAAKMNKVKKFIFTSSSLIYPKSTSKDYDSPAIKEEMSMPAEPINSYGWSKLYMELACNLYKENFGIETKIARLFGTYGPDPRYADENAKSLISICKKVAMAKDGSSIEIWGEGKENRSFSYVYDTIEGIYLLANSSCSTPINIGSDEKICLLDLTKKIIKISKKNISITHKLTNVELGVKGMYCDCSKAYELLKWKPKYSLDEGIKITYNWISKDIEKNRIMEK